MRLALLLCLLLANGFSAALEAAEFRCVQDGGAFGRVIENPNGPANDAELWPEGVFEPFGWEAGGKDDDLCPAVAIEGKIIAGDADKLEWLLSRSEGSGPAVRKYYLRSPGGDLFEAMIMGRLLRATNASVEAIWPDCGRNKQPVCCASACAIAYFGATEWNAGDRLGLHRPTLTDLSNLEYSEARSALTKAAEVVRKYLQQMDAEVEVYENMMGANPDRLTVFTVKRSYPSFLDDWLSSKCKKRHWGEPPTNEDIEFCKRLTHLEAAGATDNFEWFSHLSNQKLEQLNQNKLVGPIRRNVIQKELSHRRLKQWKPRIDAMSSEALKGYIRKEFAYRPDDDDLFSKHAFNRLEELTGDRVVGNPYSDCIQARNPEVVVASCAKYISATQEQRLKFSLKDNLLQATLRRADAFWTLGRSSEALADLTTVINAVEKKGWAYRLPIGRAELYSRRAKIREDQGKFPQVIDDLTQALRFPANSSERVPLLTRRAAAHDRVGESEKASADRAFAESLRNLGR